MVEGIPELKSTHEEFARDVPLGRTLRNHSQAATTDLRKP
jgi:hypothetical protein